jgi:hypothetical protein
MRAACSAGNSSSQHRIEPLQRFPHLGFRKSRQFPSAIFVQRSPFRSPSLPPDPLTPRHRSTRDPIRS